MSATGIENLTLGIIRRHRAQVEESINFHRESGSTTGMAVAMVRLDTLDKLIADVEAVTA